MLNTRGFHFFIIFLFFLSLLFTCKLFFSLKSNGLSDIPIPPFLTMKTGWSIISEVCSGDNLCEEEELEEEVKQ